MEVPLSGQTHDPHLVNECICPDDVVPLLWVGLLHVDGPGGLSRARESNNHDHLVGRFNVTTSVYYTLLYHHWHVAVSWDAQEQQNNMAKHTNKGIQLVGLKKIGIRNK